MQSVSIWLYSNRLKFSIAKVEKVVYPPQNPVISSNLRCELSEGKCESRSPAKKPIQKQPNIFTRKVAKGNVPA